MSAARKKSWTPESEATPSFELGKRAQLARHQFIEREMHDLLSRGASLYDQHWSCANAGIDEVIGHTFLSFAESFADLFTPPFRATRRSSAFAAPIMRSAIRRRPMRRKRERRTLRVVMKKVAVKKSKASGKPKVKTVAAIVSPTLPTHRFHPDLGIEIIRDGFTATISPTYLVPDGSDPAADAARVIASKMQMLAARLDDLSLADKDRQRIRSLIARVQRAIAALEAEDVDARARSRRLQLI